MFTTHTSTHTTAMALERNVPNSSSFFFRGVSSSSSAASCIASRIFPIAVRAPVPITTPRALPPVTTVPPNATQVLSWITAATPTETAPANFSTDPLSPVKMLWSTESASPRTAIKRTSAGTLFPTASSTISPGTSSAAGTFRSRPSRNTAATSAWYALSSSMALSALVSVSTPTVAFATRIRTITPGSTSELQPSPSASPMSSDTAAAAIRIFTSKSSNCFSTSFQNGVPGSGGSSFGPQRRRACAASASRRPTAGSTWKCARTWKRSKAE